MGQERLAADLGCSRQQVRKYIRDLEGAGLITAERRGMNRTNCHYHHPDDLKLRLRADGTMTLPARQPDANQAFHPEESTVSIGCEAGFPSDVIQSVHDVYPENKDTEIPDAAMYKDAGIPLAAQAGALAARDARPTRETPKRRHLDQEYFDALGLPDPFSLPGHEQGKYLVLIEDAKKNGVCPDALRQYLEDRGYLVQRELTGLLETG